MSDKKPTDSEIVKALESYKKDIGCANCGFKDKYLLTTIDNVLDLINCLEARIGVYETCNVRKDEAIKHLESEVKRLQAENDDLFYKLAGVMHSVDKWLDGDELKQDEVNRAATMREKTLQIVESLQAENERLRKELSLVSILYQEEQEENKQIKSEAYKECIKRVDEEIGVSSFDFTHYEDREEARKQLNNILNELVGD